MFAGAYISDSVGLTQIGAALCSVPLKYVAISSKSDTEICEYPDSGKFLATTRLPGKRARMFRYVGRQESEVDYWDGETSPD